ncbi:hypothetical protein SAMN05216352_12130 [Alteribacillus bidgolensis]|uniref:Uncharacterized protein n=1 Tax=Alteribacillus bidgolensis TaxID=930129 RepID=A0A1G8QQ22_9BACI|nr:hypothetical protein SAMN05216352_12130 [Alteribacillus bidgolensis]
MNRIYETPTETISLINNTKTVQFSVSGNHNREMEQ